MSTTIRRNLVPLESVTGPAGIKAGAHAVVHQAKPEAPVAKAPADRAVVNAVKGSAIAVVPAILVGKAVEKHLSATGATKVLASLGHTRNSFIKLTGVEAGTTLRKFVTGRMATDLKATRSAWAAGLVIVGIAATATYLATKKADPQPKPAATP